MLPEHFTPLPLPREMAAWDALAVEEFGIRREMLMENAAREALAVLVQETGPVAGKRVLLFAGPGNNGGDAFALARHLHDQGADTLVLHMAPRTRSKGSSRYHLRLAARTGVALRLYSKSFPFFRHNPDIVVDGVLGTGFSGELRPQSAEVVGIINELGKRAFVLALDIPSGLDGVTGRPCPTAVRAHATATFEAAKPGLVLPGAGEFTGRVHVRPIGIPAVVRRRKPSTFVLLDAPGLRLALADHPQTDIARLPDLHKGKAGRVLVIGGSRGLTGAPVLAALGALRSGAGLVTVACPGGLAPELKAGFPEILTLALGKGQEWSRAMAQELGEHLSSFDALALGPGLGRDHGAHEFLSELLPALAEQNAARILDADALYWLAKDSALGAQLRSQDLLTPHPGEAALLLAPHTPDTAAVQADRPAAARRLADALGTAVVLKGAGTLIAASGFPILVSPIVSPALATGGSGDVLTGLLASLLARGLPRLCAAALGVLVHGRAGNILDAQFPQRGNLAREIALALPRALKETVHDQAS